MSTFNRRRFLAGSTALTVGTLPALTHRGLLAAEKAATSDAGDRMLVVIQMSGGNDGINTVVPFGDEGYAKHRKTLRLSTDEVLTVNGTIGLHPSMRSAADLIEDGRMAIVQGVGYPNPNRSHDVSMAIWHSAQLDDDAIRSQGWLGRAIDQARGNGRADDDDGEAEMILVGDESTPLALVGRRSSTIALSGLDDLKLHDVDVDPSTESKPIAASDDLESFIEATARNARLVARRLNQSSDIDHSSHVQYPSTQLAGRLKTISSLIKVGFRTPVYYTIHSGYDTHAAQAPTHARLLWQFSGAIKAFLDDLKQSGLSDRVLVMAFSEFGRRVTENASAGTDHGTAGPMFVAGDHVHAGLIGDAPRLTDLVEGDLRMEIDFRRIYHELLASWLFPNGDWSYLSRQERVGIVKS